jgi:hypothetical protein
MLISLLEHTVQGQKNISLSHRVQECSGVHKAFSLGVKATGGAKATAPRHRMSSLRIHGDNIFALHYIAIVWCLFKHSENLPFTGL